MADQKDSKWLFLSPWKILRGSSINYDHPYKSYKERRGKKLNIFVAPFMEDYLVPWRTRHHKKGSICPLISYNPTLLFWVISVQKNPSELFTELWQNIKTYMQQLSLFVELHRIYIVCCIWRFFWFALTLTDWFIYVLNFANGHNEQISIG